jgi:hypothetical protein
MSEVSNQISSVLSTQLEKQVHKVRSSIKSESRRYERLKSQLSLTNHQLSLYTEESLKIRERLENSLSMLTKDSLCEIRSIKAPVSAILDLCDKVLLIIDIKDRSWKSFRNISKNFPAFQNLLISAQSEQLPEPIINEVLPLWKNQASLRNKLVKINAGACYLLDWLVNLVEFNVKSEIIVTSKKRIPELEKMIKNQTKTLSELTSESVSIEEILNKTKQNLDEQDPDECSELSLTSKPYPGSKDDDRVVFHSTVHRGTASGGILNSKSSVLRAMNSNFPNFSSDSLYGEIPKNKTVEEEPIIYEGSNEMIGCCRMKFFCF